MAPFRGSDICVYVGEHIRGNIIDEIDPESVSIWKGGRDTGLSTKQDRAIDAYEGKEIARDRWSWQLERPKL